jgi:hypothetical protein
MAFPPKKIKLKKAKDRMNNISNLEALERLCILVESAGIDIAPNFYQYADIAFGIANAVGEAGRVYFHRLCAVCPKYQYDNAERIFTNALKTGRGENGLGTVFHHAEQAGVNLGDLKRFVSTKTDFLGNFRTGARTLYTPRETTLDNNGKNGQKSLQNGQNSPQLPQLPPTPRGNSGTGKTGQNGLTEEEPEGLPYEGEYANTPAPFPTYEWPSFLQRILDCSTGIAQRDMLFCGTMGALGETVSPFTYFNYSNDKQYPNLQVFVIAPAASGKGAISWIRRLVMPFHKEKIARYEAAREAYQIAYRTWANEGRNRDEAQRPVCPRMELFFIAGDNTGTGIQENIIDNNGFGLIMEAEAEVLSAAIQSEYGHWSHTLRKAFDHEFLSYNRRKDKEYRECDCLRVSVVICGTPGQLKPFIPNTENGLFSRQLFYFMPSLEIYLNMFETGSKKDYSAEFMKWGERWKMVIDAIRTAVQTIEFLPNKEQTDKIHDYMSRLFYHAGTAHGGSMRGSVVRLAINLTRIMNVVALLRALNPLLMMEDENALKLKLQNITATLMECDGLSVADSSHPENVKDGIISKFILSINDADFEAVLNLAEPFYRHAEHALMSLPEEPIEKRKVTNKERFLASLPMSFTRQKAIQLGEKYGFTERSCEHILENLVSKGIIERIKRGEYRFVGGKRAKDLGRNPPNNAPKSE